MAGASLHGGGADRGSLINSSFFHAGQFYTGMVVVVFFLAPEGPGDGGLGIVRGSHKAELPMPPSVRGSVSDLVDSTTFNAAVTEVHADAGDCVIFAEAVSHLTMPWRGAPLLLPYLSALSTVPGGLKLAELCCTLLIT